ncbi:hypothetical protein HII31_08740 [Pseudocercospora fuligena]|uniref:Uncharacterized protein n=1 Tax=Pseudocercospora fuligena TaxID=685502 RepID=A0A8H6RF14_9PEZI|nr:hypothetical protein HII31_08740 [Pseudocercospora fuligena]
MVFGPWPTQMSEAEHVTAVLSHCGGDVFQLLPSLKSALLELRTDQKNSWQAMELCNPTRYGGIEVHVNVQIGSWILEFRHSIYKARPMTLGAVLREALENREDDDFTRHAWAYQYDGTPECLDYFTLNHWPYYEGTSVFALGSQSLQELITEKEQEYGVNAVMDVAPTIALSHCIQPSETVKKEVRERGSEAYVVAKLKEGRSKVAGMPVGHPGGNWFH